jgi:uncharacterized membrane protein YsdA (DUF1294 family)
MLQARKQPAMNRTSRTHFFILIGLCVVALAICYLAFQQFNLDWYITWLLFWSGVAFVYYGFDKGQAGRGGWRVPELILHALALLGGFVGGWAAMLALRHKVRKPIFSVILLISVALHVAIYVLLQQLRG